MLSLLGVIHLECLGVVSGRAWSSCQSMLNSRISARGATQAALCPGRRDPPLVGRLKAPDMANFHRPFALYLAQRLSLTNFLPYVIASPPPFGLFC